MKKIYVMSLGCPRNLVDSEVLEGLLEEKGFAVTEDAGSADVAIVNTCGFTHDAKQESIDMILRLVELKKDQKIKKLVVTGCLSQRYPAELPDEIKEIDGVFGTSDFVKIPEFIGTLLTGEKASEVGDATGFLYNHSHNRLFLTPPHYAYLKIQEGCSNRCSYCVIPTLRGPLRSRGVDSILAEARAIKEKRDIKELILIGQDITSFGLEKKGGAGLHNLLIELSPAMGEAWIRLLYTHPAHFTDDLISVMGAYGNICNYVDIPVQHISDRILSAMDRHITKLEIIRLMSRLRGRIKDAVLRSTVIVGFPGETDEEFEELLDFLADVKFDRLGAFIYSREEGTKAGRLSGQVDEDTKKQRFDRVMSLQEKISRENNLKYLGKTLKVLIEEPVECDERLFAGRSYMDAPEVDGVVYVSGENLSSGTFRDVKITGTMEYDLKGECI